MNLIPFIVISWIMMIPKLDPVLDDREEMLQSVACKPHPRQMAFQEMEFIDTFHWSYLIWKMNRTDIYSFKGNRR